MFMDRCLSYPFLREKISENKQFVCYLC